MNKLAVMFIELVEDIELSLRIDYDFLHTFKDIGQIDIPNFGLINERRW